MTKIFKKMFGEINLTWPKIIIAAVLAGVFTAAMAIIPALHYTSFNTITVTFEVWILFGILIIMNSKSNLDSALKCFVFFLISQPLVYLIQVPFSPMGWHLFSYYKYWFIWTILCFPMGFVGYFMKKDKWWGYLILFPMILITAYSYATYFTFFLFYMPKYILICLFCICGTIFYPVLIFNNKKIRLTGMAIGIAATIALTIFGVMNRKTYSTEILGNNEETPFNDTYTVSIGDEECGTLEIIYDSSAEDYMIHAEFVRGGKTTMTLEAPDGQKQVFDLTIEIDTYSLKARK